MYDALAIHEHHGLCPCYRCYPKNRETIAYRQAKHAQEPVSRVKELEELIWRFTLYYGDPFFHFPEQVDARNALLREGMFIWRTRPELADSVTVS